jgi:hypothetical protein
MKPAIIIAALLLTGCTGQLVEVRERTSLELDSTEQFLRETSSAYRQRFNRISQEWICTGMSWPDLVALVNGDMDLVNAIMKACAARSFPVSGP